MGLGFGVGGETVRLENGDGGGDNDFLRFYVAIIVPQMPLSEIDGMVNLISAWRAKERHLIFYACWRHCLARCEIFAENQIYARANLPVFSQQRSEFIPCFNRKCLQKWYLISVF
jgi:hypothetical protein